MADAQDKVATVVEHDKERQEPVKAVKGVDEAHNFIREHDAIEWTPEEERMLLWKIDICLIIPASTNLQFLAYVQRLLTEFSPQLLLANIMTACDSQAYGIAAIFGLIQDLKLYTVDIHESCDPQLDKILLDKLDYDNWNRCYKPKGDCAPSI